MGQLSLVYFLNGKPVTFTKCNNSWYFSANELSAFSNISASEYINSADTRDFIDALSDYMNLPENHIVINDVEDQPELGALLINDLAMDYIQRFCPDILPWILDRMMVFDIYAIPFDNVPLSRADRKKTRENLLFQSKEDGLTPEIKSTLLYCADIFKD